MEITLFRRPAWFARSAVLDVFVGDRRIASIRSGEAKTISLPDGETTFKVGMDNTVFSLPVQVRSHGKRFEAASDYGYWLTLHRFAICHSSRIVSSLSGPFLMSVQPDQGMSICSGHVDPKFAGVFRLSHF